MISDQDVHLYRITDSYKEAVQEILQFYSNYHSMRYVRNNLVLRLNRKLDEELLAEINDTFPDILVDGRFRQTAALHAEKDEADLSDLPRLVFHFNRHDHGRLRQLIDFLNRRGPALDRPLMDSVRPPIVR